MSTDWLVEYWWVPALTFLVDVLLSVIKGLKCTDRRRFLANKPELPPYHDFNDKWGNDDDWLNKDQPKG